MKVSTTEKKSIQQKANLLAKKASNGDSSARDELQSLIKSNSYLAALVNKAIRRINKANKKAAAKDNSLKVKSKSTGSVMSGLTGKTSSKNWKKTK
jgi:hypothetical protein